MLEIKPLDPRFGFHDNSVARRRASPDEVARLAEGTGAGMYRLLIDWRSTEPAPDVYDFGMSDRIYAALRARGIRPLFVLAWAPTWAWAPAVQCSGDQCHFPPGRDFDGQWREMAAVLAKRYPDAAGIEIWNEPNERTAWNWAADVGRYSELLREAYTAIKAVEPSMPVISGGLSNRQESADGSMSLADFARELFAHDAAHYMDGIGIHPYVPKDLLEGFGKTLDLVRSLRPGDLPIWVTEVGVTTSGPAADSFHASENEQAHVDTTAYRYFKSQADVKAILIHTLIDPYNDPRDPESGFGVLRSDLREKPAYCALAHESGARRSCP
jgi:polysaccharide biosynthesis protein PslG